MSLPAEQRERLLTLLDAVFDQRAQAADYAEIEQLVLGSPEARWLYLTYVELHGTLIWDAAAGLGLETAEPVIAAAETAPPAPRSRLWNPSRWAALATAVMCASLLIGVAVGRYALPLPSTDTVAGNAPEAPATATVEPESPPRPRTHRPVDLPLAHTRTPLHPEESGDAVAQAAPANTTAEPVEADDPTLDPVTRTALRIDRQLARVWSEGGVSPSPLASDSVWLRRVMLDVSGRIPSIAEIEAFTNQDRRNASVAGQLQHRRELVDRLLAEGDYVRNFSTVWLNLLVGRSPPEQVDREAFQKFLRMSFAANQPWNQIVAELLSAEGRTDQNGATNYLVAHLNNQAVPATAITSRLFLGQQLHCAQCHHHPFNQVQQASFWELNSLFQQTEVVRDARPQMAPEKGPRMGPPIAALVTRPEGGPIYYETTNGLMKVAFPRFNGQEVDPGEQTNRRKELARLLTTTDQPQLAAAFVNRTWAHFFGQGFTTPIDDMGPHNPPCHPEVLQTLQEEFIRSGYDVQHLIRCITATQAYQLSGQTAAGNAQDDPAIAPVPLFSHMYPKPMSAEQLYDSLVVATQAHQAGATDWTVAEARRRDWLHEFVVSLNNDENDEAETLSGTYSQALTLMNGELMERALDLAPGTLLGEVARSRTSDADKIRQLCLAALSRPPTAKELPAMQKLLRENSAARRGATPRSPATGLQDLFWALLNSNEFAINH